MKKAWTKRLLSLLLVVAMVAAYALPASAIDTENVKITQIDNSAVSATLPNGKVDETEAQSTHEDTDVVRVSIVLNDAGTIAAGYDAEDIANNDAAMAYRAALKNNQNAVAKRISSGPLKGEKLDVVWNLTLAADIISANVPFGAIDEIKKVSGVKDVLLETVYEPAVVDTDEAADPNMSTSSEQIGSNAAYAAGYTGAGSRIAIIDTGTDDDHQSFQEAPFLYALEKDAEAEGMEMSEFLKKIDLLDLAEISVKMDKLNIASVLEQNGITAKDLYKTAKLPFAFNYVDENLNINHDGDTQGEHGSHVAGIAAANRYIEQKDGSFVDALSSVHTQGVAPDAQIITMKVFGKAGGAYDSDYMVAIEDAIILNCDSVNLSLGSGNPGASTSTTAAYQAILDSLVESNTVVTMSAGNSGHWFEQAAPAGYPYIDGVSFDMAGSPGSFTNSLGVASVDNDGFTGEYITSGDTNIFYTQSSYKNSPLSTLAGEQEFVMVEGTGTPEDFAAVGEALTGKIALCYRGNISFYQKAENAVAAGAIGTIIVNNQPGVINMDLSDYTQTAPCVSVTQADGEVIKANAEAVKDEAGNVLYYTGKLTVGDSIDSVAYHSDYYTMSDFSSWGVPGSLQLKPEITAPGGSIYSVNGAVAGGQAYETMSGTSMAAPQVAGMAALVAQYIRENDLAEKTGLTVRALTNSLLMSTAVPVVKQAEDEDSFDTYYPVLQQGSGLANVGNAVSSDGYILMGDDATVSAADGKVKAELGEDADRKGEYTFSFSIHNLTDKETAYDLAADLFTQDAFAYYANDNQDVAMFLDTLTADLSSSATWTVDGKPTVFESDLEKYDVNKDGTTDEDDVQAILDYIAGNEIEIDKDAADVDLSGGITSRDARALLKKLSTSHVVVPANGSANVEVTLKIAESDKEYLDTYYTAGAYVEGYVYATPVTSEDGAKGVELSIPVLGYYGSWTDGSMYDVGSAVAYGTGEEVRDPYLGNKEANAVGITYANQDGTFYFGSNPIDFDETYHPERNAINTERGDEISVWKLALIRNSAGGQFTVKDLTSNETFVQKKVTATNAAYYYTNGSSWQGTQKSYSLKQVISGGSEGDTIELKMTMAPEYYLKEDGTIDFDALHDGASQTYTAVVDNTAPVLKDVALDLVNNTLRVTAQDNRYLAGALLYNKAGTELLSYAKIGEDAAEGKDVTLNLSLENVNGKKFILQVCDYAMNVVTFEVEANIGGEVALPDFIAFDCDENYWTSFNTKTTNEEITAYSKTENTFLAGTICDHIVFASTDEGDLYVMPEEDLTDETLVRNLGVIVTDMAYNAADGNIYGVADNMLGTIDKLTGEWTEVAEIGVDTNTLACDANGTFYCHEFATSNVYSFTLETISEPTLLVSVGSNQMVYAQAMEVSPNNGKLYWNSYYAASFFGMTFGFSYLYEIDTKTGEFTRYNDLYDELTALLIPVSKSGGSWTAPVDYVSGLSLSAEELNLLAGSAAKLSVAVQPWTASDRSVTWTSENEEIATVNADGVVTAIGEGTTTITATSNLNSEISASCTVNVSTVKTTIRGALQNAEGNPMFYEWDLENNKTWTEGTAVDTSIDSATKNNLTGKLYICDATSDAWNIHEVDAETGKTDKLYANSTGIPMWDMSYSDVLSTEDAPIVNAIYYYYLLAGQDPTNLNSSAFKVQSYLNKYSGADHLVAVATLGAEQVEDDETGDLIDTEAVVMLDNAGYLWKFNIYNTEEGMNAFLSFAASDLGNYESFPGNEDDMYCSMVADEAGNLYVSAFNGEVNNLYYLQGSFEDGAYVANYLGNFGTDVWPATIFEAEMHEVEDARTPVTVSSAMKISAEPVSAEELATAKLEMTKNRTANIDNSQKDAVAEQEATGSLNAVTGKTVKADINKMDVRAAKTEGTCTDTVKVTVTADQATANGLLAVEYDNTTTELVNVESDLQYFGTCDLGEMVGFSYACEDEVDADTVLATFTFKVTGASEAKFTVGILEDGESDPYTITELTVATEHAWGEWETTKEATCTEKGEETRTCANCGATETREVEAKGHSFGEWVVTKEADCGVEGEEVRTCSVCGATETRVIPAKACPSDAFVDVNTTAWYHTAVDWAVSNGYMKGTDSAHFAPNTTAARAMLVTILYRMAGSPAVEGESKYEDVKEGSYFYNAVVWGTEQGIVNGVSESRFAPDQQITREQVATILYRYAEKLGLSLDSKADLTEFPDHESVSGFAVEGMKWAVGNKIINGAKQNGTVVLNPKALATRAQLAQILMGFEKLTNAD